MPPPKASVDRTAVSVHALRVRGVPEDQDGEMRVAVLSATGVFAQAPQTVDVRARTRLAAGVRW